VGIGDRDAPTAGVVTTAAVVIAGVVGPVLLVTVLARAFGSVRLTRHLADGEIWQPVLATVVPLALVYTACAPATRLGHRLRGALMLFVAGSALFAATAALAAGVAHVDTGHLGLLALPWLLVHVLAVPALFVAGPVATARGERLAFVAACALALGCLQFVAPSWGWLAAGAVR
jgi:hypothetical protein